MKHIGYLLALLSSALLAFDLGGEASRPAITWKGQPFLLSEEGVPAGPREAAMAEAAGWRVANLAVKSQPMPFRREIAVSQDRRAVEVGFQSQLTAYHGRDPGSIVSYGLVFDLKRFAGGTWLSVTGRAKNPVENRGAISADGSVATFGGKCRALILTSADGKESLVFDFNLEGITSSYDSPPNSIAALWNAALEKGILKCSASFAVPWYGGVYCSRIRIYEGDHATWRRHHPQVKFPYTAPMAVSRLIAFGDNTVGKRYKRAGAWQKGAPRTITLAASGAMYSAAAADQPAAYRLDDLEPGTYLATLRFTAYQNPVGPFDATLGGTTILRGATIPANTVATATRFVHLDRSALLELSGSWQLSSLALQPLSTDTEDLHFRRGFWLLAGRWEPTPYHASKNYLNPPEYRTDFDLAPLPPHDWKMPARYQPPRVKKTFRPDDTDTMAWRYDSSIATWGTPNSGAFLEFDTPEKVARRLDELQREGSTTIMTNGLLSRHTYRGMEETVENFFRRMVPEAHKRGLKVVDHQDFSLLWGHGDGIRVAASRPGAIQQSVDYATGVRGYCPNHPALRAEYMQEIARQVRVRGLDGIMIDEVYFYQPEFCGCSECRRKFHADTGLYLPMDETSPELLNPKSLLWRAFIDWRMRCVGDWFVELRHTVAKDRKDFSIMIYTTHYGWGSDFASVGKGAALPDAARACDFLGTEIMTRNVAAARRPVLAYRKMMNTMATPGKCPVFGLIYPLGNFDIAYFGWALNNVANQLTWFTIHPPQPQDGAFLAFRGVPSRRFTFPTARIAVLYDLTSKDFAKNMNYNNEPLGIGELLNDLGLQYEYIFTECLAQLKGYDVLMVLNASSLDDTAIQRILAFARNGGTVYLSGNAALYDQMGQPRKEWPFAHIFGGNAPKVPFQAGNFRDLHGPLGQCAGPMLGTRVGGNPRANGIQPLLSANTRSLVFSAPYGKGRVIYSAFCFGTLLCERELTVGNKYAWNPAPDLLRLVRQFLRNQFAAASTLQYDEVPEGVYAGLYIERRPAQKPRLVLHLLNGTGIDLKPGETIPGKGPKGIWTPIEKPLRLRVTLNAGQWREVGDTPTTATALSPDFVGPRAVRLQPQPDGSLSLTVPVGALKRYSVVILE